MEYCMLCMYGVLYGRLYGLLYGMYVSVYGLLYGRKVWSIVWQKSMVLYGSLQGIMNREVVHLGEVTRHAPLATGSPSDPVIMNTSTSRATLHATKGK